jgi:hypothetical protein
MNRNMMKKNVHSRVLLQPPAYRLDHHGFEVKAVEDEWWIVQEITDEGVTISDPRSGHFRLLGYDHIQKFTSDGMKQGAKRGFLTLLVQLYIQGNDVRVLPTRPGEPLPPPRPVVVDKVVESNYPTASGIQQRLEAQGYALSWVRPERVGTIELQGGHAVVERDAKGLLATFRTRDGMVLVKHPSRAR